MATTDDNTCPVPTARRCQASTKVSPPFCVDDGDCGTAKIQKTEVIAADCSAVESYQLLDLSGVVVGAWTGSTKQVSCEPMRVKVVDSCDTPPTAPITITGADCAGAPVAATGLPQQIVQTVPHPSAVQLVKICSPTPKLYDREMQVLCAPDGTKVLVQNVTAEDAPLGTAPVFEAWNLNGTPYTGALAALVDCAKEKIDITDGEDYCLNGVNYTRIDLIDVNTELPVASIWLNDAGAPVAAPVGATKGICQDCQPKPCCPRDAFYQSGGTLVLSPTQQAVTFDNYPSLTTDVPNTTSTADLYLYTIEHGPTGLWDTLGGLNTSIFTAVPWANAQSAVDLFLTNAGLPIGSVIASSDGAGQPVFVFDTNIISTGDIAWWVGDSNTYTAKIKATIPFAGAVIAGVECRMIKLIDTLQCDGTYTTEALELDNRRVDGFDPAKLVAECPCKGSTPVGVVSTWG